MRELVTFEGPPVSAILTTHRHRGPLAGARSHCRRGGRGRVRRRRRRGRACPSPSTSACSTATRSRRRADARDHRAARPHTRFGRRPLSRPGRFPASVHRRLLFPGGVGKTTSPADSVAHRRRRAPGLRRAAGRDVGLPRPRRRLHPRRRASAPRRLAGTGLVGFLILRRDLGLAASLEPVANRRASGD